MSDATPIEKPLRVFVIGSSTTLRMDPYLRKLFTGRWAYSRKGDDPEELRLARSDLDVPRGASAGNSRQVVAYLREVEQRGGIPADFVLLHVGAHDIKRTPDSGEISVPLEEYRHNVEWIARWFQTQSSRLVWMRSGPISDEIHNQRSAAFRRYQKDMDACNAAADDVMRRYGVPALDLQAFNLAMAPLEESLEDHVHFKPEFARQQAAYVVGWMNAWAIRGQREKNGTEDC